MHSRGMGEKKTKQKGDSSNLRLPLIFQPFKTVTKYLAKTTPCAISTAVYKGLLHPWCWNDNFLTRAHVYL